MNIKLMQNGYGQWLAEVYAKGSGAFLAKFLIFAKGQTRRPDEHSIWEAMAVAEEKAEGLLK